MPEAPDLFVIMEFLEPRLAGRTIVAAEERKPLVLRNMVDQKFSGDIAARKITAVHRKGKLLLSLGDERGLVISPMLTDALRHCSPSDRIEASTVLTFDLDDGHQLRYFDQKRMGEVYYLHPAQLGEIVRLENQGPDVLDEPMDFDDSSTALKPYRGEIKGILTEGSWFQESAMPMRMKFFSGRGYFRFARKRASMNRLCAISIPLYTP